MILKRFSRAIRERDWTAIAIEFVIVVVGIFVALQADGWNQERQDRRLEQEYLARLADEARANLGRLSEYAGIMEDKVRFILALREASPAELAREVQRDPRAFAEQLDNSTWVALTNLREESYRELEGSGRLRLLRDQRLRDELASSIVDYESTRAVFTEASGDYRRMVLEVFPGRVYYDSRVGSRAPDGAALVAAVESLRGAPRFEAAANAEVAYGADMLFWIRHFQGRWERILSLIENGS